MSGGGGGSSQTQSTTVTPWKGVQPHLTDYLKQSQTQQGTPFQFNAGDQIAPFSPEQQYGLAATTQRAIQGSPVNMAAQNNAYGTLQGDFMSPDSNPWLKQNVGRAMDDVQTRVNSQFNNANFGGTAHQEVLSRGLGETAAGMYGENYQQERGRQMQAQALAPGLAETDYRDMQALLGVGDARRGLSQDYLNQANGLFNQNVEYPQQQLDAYGRAIGLGMGVGSNQVSKSPNPNQSSPLAGAIGGAATGFSVGGPWGAAAGGILGGLFG